MPHPLNVIELLQDMVSIPSVNPSGNPGIDQTGEQAMGEYVSEFLRRLGADVSMHHVEIGRPNVVASFTPDKPVAHLAFAPHLDTVSVVGMTIPPFNPAIHDGKLFGRGASDTKGPMAAALWALHEWAQSPARAKSRIKWTFLGLMGEEAGGNGAMAMVDKKFSCDLALVLEPTQLGVVTAHKGNFGFTVITQGVACHSSTPEKGRNAIYAMRQVLQAIEEKIIPGLSRYAHPRLGNPTMNVGLISGGTKTNIVPNKCAIEVDCRIVPGLEPEEFRARIEAELREVEPDVVVNFATYRKPLDTSEALPWVQRVGKTARGFTTAPWYSDAAVLAGPDCPAVCVGPGSIAQAHTKDEFISLSDLEDGVDFFRRWIATAEESPA